MIPLNTQPDKELNKLLWRTIVIIVMTIIFLLGVTQCKAQVCSPATDTITEGTCVFHTIDTVFTNQTASVCMYFKSSTEYINLDLMFAQGISCGPIQYSSLDVSIFNDSCDTMFYNVRVYPPAGSMFIGPLDTTRYYKMCVKFKAKCTLVAICPQYNISPLPVRLEYFKAYREKDCINLEWKTQTEVNNDYFTIEKAGDNFIFMPIGKVYGQGNKTSPTFYFYKDKSPYEGVNYYRLQQVDWDGHTTEYGPVAIPFKITEEEKALFIYYDLIGRRIR